MIAAAAAASKPIPRARHARHHPSFASPLTAGVVSCPPQAQAFAFGAKVYWSNKNATTTVTGNALIGVVASAAATSDPTVRVRLNGISASLSRRHCRPRFYTGPPLQALWHSRAYSTARSDSAVT